MQMCHNSGQESHISAEMQSFNHADMHGKVQMLSNKEIHTVFEKAKNTVFVNSLDNLFHQVIDSINNELTIGLHVKGFDLNSDSVRLLTLVTQKCIYQFDVLAIGDSAFKLGLQLILEGDVEKVIHNCSMFSYYLRKKHSIILRNVFDTAVGELMISKSFTGEFPEAVCTLYDCVKVFLGVPSTSNKCNDLWGKILNTEDLKLAAAQEAAFLLPLKEHILARMMTPLKLGFNFYLERVKQASAEDALEQIGTEYLLPVSFKHNVENDCTSVEF